jgi:hypothetical protein
VIANEAMIQIATREMALFITLKDILMIKDIFG